MTIECYYSECKHHNTQFLDDGPFCDEYECLATQEELQKFALIRQEYLRKVYPNESN